MMRILLPWPPSVNHYYRRVGARTLISREGRDYRLVVASRCLLPRVRRLTGPLAVTVDAYPPDRRRRDLDNLLKSLLDALQHAGVYEDDSQIRRLVAEMHETEDRAGRVEVTVETKGNDE